MAGAVIMAILTNFTAAVATKPFARRLIANSHHARPAIWPLTTCPTIRIPLLYFAATPRIRYLENSLKPHLLRTTDHNDIRADFGATWQIRYTTIHDRLRIGGRLYELRPFAMRACVVKIPFALSRAARPRRINEEFAFVLVELLPRSSANPLETLTSSGPALRLQERKRRPHDRPTFGGSTVVRIPRSILSALVIDIDDIVMRPIPGETNTLKTSAWLCERVVDRCPVGIAARASTPDRQSNHRSRRAHAWRHARCRSYRRRSRCSSRPPACGQGHVMENSSRRNLSVADVAKHLGVSNRHVQRLFESDGTTFSTFLLDYRLACAYRMLCKSQYGHWGIGKIADYAGFADLSYFGRCFRKRYGSKPRDIRSVDWNSKPLE